MVPAPYSAMTVVPCAKAMGFAPAVTGSNASASTPTSIEKNRFMEPSENSIKDPRRSDNGRERTIDQRIGGGFSGGSEREMSGAGGSASTRSETARTFSENGMLGAATPASVQETRQPVIESTPSGQHGHSSPPLAAAKSSQGVEADALLGAAAANAIAGTASRSWAATTR